MPPVETPTNKKYHLTAKFNQEVFECDTDDIKDALMAIKPSALHTEFYLTIKHDQGEIDRKVDLVKARRMFLDEQQMEIFIINLLLP